MGRPKGKSDLGTLDAVTRWRLWLTTAALAVSGCGGPFPQSTLHPRSDFARATDVLFTDIFWWAAAVFVDRKSTRLNSSHGYISYAVFCLKKKKTKAAWSIRTSQRRIQ